MPLQMLEPEGFPVLATTKVAGVLTLTETGPKVSEIEVATSVDLSLFVGSLPAEISTNTGTKPARLGSSLDLGRGGRTQVPAFTVRYPYDPQDFDDSTANNKAKLLLRKGVRLWIVVRKGLDADVPFAIGHNVELWRVQCYDQNRPNDGDEYADNEISQVLAPVRRPIYDKKLVA